MLWQLLPLKRICDYIDPYHEKYIVEDETLKKKGINAELVRY